MITKGNCSISCFFTIVYEVIISSMPRTLNTLSKNRRFLAKMTGKQARINAIVYSQTLSNLRLDSFLGFITL